MPEPVAFGILLFGVALAIAVVYVRGARRK